VLDGQAVGGDVGTVDHHAGVGLVGRPGVAPAPWSARQAHTSSISELPLLSISSVAAVPAVAPPIRKKTSSMLTGFEAGLTAEPCTPTWSSAGELVGPGSKIMPETLTPPTSATFIWTPRRG
jgi:hypothetical protein